MKTGSQHDHPHRMRALVYHGPRDLRLEMRDIPEPGPGEVLLRVRAAGICGSELEGYLGRSSIRRPPLVMGHEFSGEVAALGPQTDTWARPGQLVAVNPIVSCGACTTCRAGHPQVCANRALIGAHRPGAFADHVAVPASSLLPVADGLSPALVALAEPFATSIHGIGLARLQPGDAVVVWGAGAIGLFAIRAARLAGVERVVAAVNHPARFPVARAMGATAVVDARAEDALATIRAHVADAPRTVAVDAVGSAATRRAAASVVGPAGAVVLLGLREPETTFDVAALIRAEIALLGSYAYRTADLRQALDHLAAGVLPGGDWLTERPLDAGPVAFAELIDAPGAAVKIILVPAT